MTKLPVIFVLVLASISPFVVTLLEAKSDLGILDVFETGKVSTTYTQVDESDPASPPKPLLIVTVAPTVDANYPVIMFLHGTCLINSLYSDLFQHISSHGYIIVAPQYGHMDMLNDNITDFVGSLTNSLCKSSQGPRKPMRRAVGGIVVAFFKAYFKGEIEDYMTIVQEPFVAPAKLDPVQFIEA